METQNLYRACEEGLGNHVEEDEKKRKEDEWKTKEKDLKNEIQKLETKISGCKTGISIVGGFLVWAVLFLCAFLPWYYKGVLPRTVVRESCFTLQTPNVTVTYTAGIFNCDDCRVCGLLPCTTYVSRNQTGDCCGPKCEDSNERHSFCEVRLGNLYDLRVNLGVSGGYIYTYKSSSFINYVPIENDLQLFSKVVFDCWHYYGDYEDIYIDRDLIKDDGDIIFVVFVTILLATFCFLFLLLAYL